MFSDTLFEEHQKQLLDQQQPNASAGQMDQMAGTGELDEPEPAPAPSPQAPEDALPPPVAPPAEPQAAPPPPNAPPDLLAQVRAGGVSRPAVDTAFGPPPAPLNEPNTSAGPQGTDWKGLADRLASAHQRAGTGRAVQTAFANAANPGKYVEDTHAGEDDVNAAEDELKIAQAHHQQDIQDSQESDRKGQLARQTEADKLRNQMAQIGWAQKAKEAEDKLKADTENKQMTAEEKAVADQRAEEQLQEARRHNLATEGNASKAIDERDKLAAAKAKSNASAGGPALVLKEGELDKVPESLRSEVGSVLKGDAPLRKPTKSDPSAALINHWVYQLKPDFDPSAYGRRVKTQEEFATGKVGQGINALNTAIAHLGELEKSIPDNSNSQLWNKIKNEWLEKTGNPVNRDFDVAKTAVSSELAKAYSTGVATEGEVKGFMDQLSRDSSPDQLRTTAAAFKRFLAGKIAATQHQFAMGAGDRAIPGGILSPEAQQSLGGGSESAATKAPDQEGDEKPLPSGATAIFRNGKWGKK